MTPTAIAVEQIPVDADIALEVASHEALIRQTYKDSAGVLTWCVGMTNATGHNVERYIGKPASLQHCMNLFAWALKNYAAGVRKRFAGRKLTKAQFAAALSFHWNTGAIGTAKWVGHFLAGDMAAAERAFLSWNKPPEIKGRRMLEADLLFRGKWSNKGTMPEYTRLTKKMTPVWSSRTETNVAAELRAAFGGRPEPALDDAPKPHSKPLSPTSIAIGREIVTPVPAPDLKPRETPVTKMEEYEQEIAPPRRPGLFDRLKDWFGRLTVKTGFQYLWVAIGAGLVAIGLPPDLIDAIRPALENGWDQLTTGGGAMVLLIGALKGISEAGKDKVVVDNKRVPIAKMEPEDRRAVEEAVSKSLSGD